ncbi:MAG: ComEC/Rec2 family competence protein [Alphaproteobacteria bacterium]
MSAAEILDAYAQPVSAPAVVPSSVRNFLFQELARQKPRFFLWFPVFISVGIAAYFSLPAEPPLIMGGAAVIASLAVMAIVTGAWRVASLILFLICLGFFAGQIHTVLVYTPLLQKEISPAMVSGRIESIEGLEDGKGSRLMLNSVQIEKLATDKTPVKIRLSVRSDEGLRVGQTIRVLAGLNPPSPPLTPGGFDFQRYMYFQRIGALGFAFKKPEVIEGGEAKGDFIERIRAAIDARISAAMPYPAAAIAMALTTGRRAAIGDETNDAITAAGLAHILSISGLHIGLVSGIIFFVVRLLMVLIPGFALRYPAKKYAAVFAFAGAVFYTLLAGATVPTQRSLIMIGIALLAIILDRSPLSMRLVAFAASAVLLFAPDSLTGPSFQMSFAAVAGLVLVFDYLRGFLSSWYSGAGAIKKAALYICGICLTTIVATIATAPFTVFHFQQLSLYGLIGNALAVPLSSFFIMPAAVLSFLAMPFGLEYWPLQIMSFGISGMVDISVWVASLPHALLKIPAMPPAVLPLFVCGGLFLFLWDGRLRFLGVLPIILGMVMYASYRPPDILVDPSFEIVAIKAPEGDLYISNLRREKFTREKWESVYGLEEGTAKKWPKEGREGLLSCDESACRAEIRGRRVSILKEVLELREECAWADVVLSFERVRKNLCGGKPVIDKTTVRKDGAHAIWLEEKSIHIENAESHRGIRPWSSRNVRLSGKSASNSPAGPGF